MKLLEADPDVQEAKRLKAELEQQRQESANTTEFFKEFEAANNRAFDPKTDAQTFLKVKAESEQTGKSMSDIYTKVHNQTLTQRLADLELKMKAAETNKANAESTPGSVSTGGTTTTAGELTWEVFETNKRNGNWMKKNFDKVMELYRKG